MASLCQLLLARNVVLARESTILVVDDNDSVKEPSFGQSVIARVLVSERRDNSLGEKSAGNLIIASVTGDSMSWSCALALTAPKLGTS